MILFLAPADMADMLRWLAWLWLAGWLVRPLVAWLMPGLGIGALVAAKALGLLVFGYAAWLPAALGLADFSATAPAFGLLGLGLCFLVAPAGRRPAARQVLVVEALFVLVFLLGLGQRLSMPDLTGLEKFTNLAFITASMRAEAMPPEDAWLAGHGVNYYYLGQAMTAAWALLADVRADAAYQLMMSTIFALGGLLTAALVFELLHRHGPRTAALLAGFAGLLFLYGGNLHSLLYTVFRPWMPTTLPVYRFSDSTRFIGFDPETGDRAFTEFSAYAFRVGDLHAHVLAIPGFLLSLLLLLSLLRGRAAAGFGSAALLGFLLGLAWATNAWDVVCIGVAALLCWLALSLRAGRGGIDRSAALALTALAVAVAAAAPFADEFRPFGSGLALVEARTPLWQWLALHGYALPALAALLLLAAGPWRRSPEGLFALGLAACAAIYLALPELVRVVDIYAADFARANTMFKLAFRAHTVMIVAGLVAAGILLSGGGWRFLTGLAVLAPFAGTLIYAAETFAVAPARPGLDGLAFLGDERPLAEAVAAAPLRQGESIAEAAGDSFTGDSRISSASGKPAVLGWSGHEWLWHASPEPGQVRADDLAAFYQTGDPALRCRIVRRYGVRYAVVARAERETYPSLQDAAIRALGPTLVETPAGHVTTIAPGACTE